MKKINISEVVNYALSKNAIINPTNLDEIECSLVDNYRNLTKNGASWGFNYFKDFPNLSKKIEILEEYFIFYTAVKMNFII